MPLISSGVVSNYSEGSLDALKSGTKQAKNYTIIDRGGVKIGVVGSNTPETIEQVFPGNLDYKDASGAKKTITINPGVAGVNAAIAEAKAAGADVVVAVLHQGWLENADGVAKGLFNTLASQIKGCSCNLRWSQPPDIRINHSWKHTRCTNCSRTGS